MAEEEKTGTPRFEPHEWAIIVLLRAVTDQVLVPKIKKWSKKLLKDGRLCKNLAASFLNLEQILQENIFSTKENKDLNAIYRGTAGSKAKQTLINVLDITRDECKGFLLFNSYFYAAINAFGETSLVPIIPGYRTDRVLSEAQKDFATQVLPYFRKNKLPFHVNPKEIVTYSSQILPCTGGITPLHFSLFSQQTQKKGESEQIFNIPYFLGDLSILHKHEDFMQGHLSALGSIIASHENNSIGAYVLTCIMPDAFDKIDDEKLKTVINEMRNLRIISLNPPKPAVSTQGIRVMSIESGKKHISKSQIEYDIRDSFTNIFKETKDSLLAFKVDFNSGNVKDGEELGNEKLSAIAINMDGVYRMIKSIFPSGPWLDRGLVCNVEDASYPISVDQLRELCKRLCCLVHDNTSDESEQQINLSELTHPKKYPLIRKLFSEILLPELPEEGFASALKRGLLVIDLGNGYYILLVHNSSDKTVSKDDLKSFGDLGSAIISGISQDITSDGSNKLFVELQERWINEQKIDDDKKVNKRSTIETLSGTEDNALLAAIRLFIKENENIRAVLLLKERPIFLPKLKTGSWADNTYLTYPAFWLFENLNHVFEETFFDPGTVPTKIMQGYFCNDDSHYPKVEVILGDKLDMRREVINSIVFLGMRVSKWKFKKGSAATAITVNKKKYNDVLDAYRAYLKISLKNANGMESFKRIFKSSVSDPSSITVDEKDNTFNIEFNNAKKQAIEWTAEDTLQLEFCCIKDERVLEALKAKKDELWQPQFPINCENGVCTVPSVQCTLEPINMPAGLNCFKAENSQNKPSDRDNNLFNSRSNARKYICKIAERIKDIEDNASAERSKERSELLPQWAHAMGTELASISNAITLYVNRAVSAFNKRDDELIRWHKNVSEVFKQEHEKFVLLDRESFMSERFKGSLQRFEARRQEGLTEEIWDILAELQAYSYITVKNPQNRYYPKELGARYDRLAGLERLIDTMRRITLRAEVASEKNRAMLNVYSDGAKAVYVTEGGIMMQSIFYAAVCRALTRFFGATIYRVDNNKFEEDAYRHAFQNYWPQGLNKEDTEKELDLWGRCNIPVASLDDAREEFNSWLSEYKKLPSNKFVFNFDVSDQIRIAPGDARHILDILFQEVLLNALKYSSMVNNKVTITACISPGPHIRIENTHISDPYFSDTPIRRAPKGHEFIRLVMKKILRLKPVCDDSFAYAKDGSYIVEGLSEKGEEQCATGG